jgi:hypothetical protein
MTGRTAAALAAAADELDTYSLSTLEREEWAELPHEHIAVRAYHIYLERGGRPGDEFQDWVTAERELRAARNGR